MSRFEEAQLVAPHEVAEGSAANVGDMTDLYYQVGGTFTAQFDIQGSVDKLMWYNIAAAITSAVSPPVAVVNRVKWLRLNMTAYTSGHPVVIVSGYNERAH